VSECESDRTREFVTEYERVSEFVKIGEKV
jgi:hypothetical protein